MDLFPVRRAIIDPYSVSTEQIDNPNPARRPDQTGMSRRDAVVAQPKVAVFSRSDQGDWLRELAGSSMLQFRPAIEQIELNDGGRNDCRAGSIRCRRNEPA
jgi:hypothetical protein